jgi:hypothetical protein
VSFLLLGGSKWKLQLRPRLQLEHLCFSLVTSRNQSRGVFATLESRASCHEGHSQSETVHWGHVHPAGLLTVLKELRLPNPPKDVTVWRVTRRRGASASQMLFCDALSLSVHI